MGQTKKFKKAKNSDIEIIKSVRNALRNSTSKAFDTGRASASSFAMCSSTTLPVVSRAICFLADLADQTGRTAVALSRYAAGGAHREAVRGGVGGQRRQTGRVDRRSEAGCNGGEFIE